MQFQILEAWQHCCSRAWSHPWVTWFHAIFHPLFLEASEDVNLYKPFSFIVSFHCYFMKFANDRRSVWFGHQSSEEQRDDTWKNNDYLPIRRSSLSVPGTRQMATKIQRMFVWNSCRQFFRWFNSDWSMGQGQLTRNGKHSCDYGGSVSPTMKPDLPPRVHEFARTGSAARGIPATISEPKCRLSWEPLETLSSWKEMQETLGNQCQKVSWTSKFTWAWLNNQSRLEIFVGVSWTWFLRSDL